MPAAEACSSRDKGYRHGTDRQCSPSETLARLTPVLADFGITRVANITGLDRIGLPTVSVCRPNSRSLSVAQGKGVTLDAAKVSGIMEAIECYHAEHIKKPILFCSLRELAATHAVAAVERLPRVWSAAHSDERRIMWIEGVEQGTERALWLPFECVHTDYTLPLPSGSGAFVMSSNGLASGNSLREAELHGACECIERDGSCLWQMMDDEQRSLTQVNLASVDDPACRQWLDRLEEVGIAVAIWNLTTDVGVATFRAELAERDAAWSMLPLPPLPGFGCHPRREVALLRALTEAAQSRLTCISGSRDDITQWYYDRQQTAAATARFRSQAELAQERVSFRAVPTRDNASFAEDLRWISQQLTRAGVGLPVAVDLTKPEHGIAVTRVVVPGLEPMPEAPGYVPGVRAQRVRQQVGARPSPASRRRRRAG